MSKENLVPEIRFEGFGSEWVEVELGKITVSYNNKRIPIEAKLREGGIYPYYGATGIVDYVKDYIFDGEYVLLAEDGENIVSRNADISYITNGKFWVNNHAHVMGMLNGSNYFLMTLLESLNYEHLNTGTAQPKLNANTVKNIEILVSKSNEQNKLGIYFKMLDSNTNLKNKEIKELQNFKQAMLQKMFPKEGEKEPEIRFEGFEGEWTSLRISEIGTLTAGGDVNKNKLTTSGKHPVIANALSNEGIIGYYDTYTIKTPAVTITGRGDIGHATARDQEFTPVVRLLVLIPYSSFNNYFVANTINRLNIHSESTGVPQLTVPQIGKHYISFPNIKEQMKIGEYFYNLDQNIQSKQAELDKLKQFKQAMLDKMFV